MQQNVVRKVNRRLRQGLLDHLRLCFLVWVWLQRCWGLFYFPNQKGDCLYVQVETGEKVVAHVAATWSRQEQFSRVLQF